jgi:hypothetical protein
LIAKSAKILANHKRLKPEIEDLLRGAQEIDEAEDRKYGAEQRGDELPEDLRRHEVRLKKIWEAKQQMEERQKEGGSRNQ